MSNLKGWRTILTGLGIAIAPAAVNYLAGIDWTHVVGPNVAMLISGAVMVGMRLITNTPPTQSK